MSDLSKQLREALTEAGVYEQDPIIVEFNNVWEQAMLLEADEEEATKEKKARRGKTEQMLQLVNARIDKQVKEALQAGRLGRFLRFLRNEVRGQRTDRGRGAQDPTQMRRAAQVLAGIVQAVYSDEAPEDKIAAHVRKLVDEDPRYREEFEREVLDRDRQDIHPLLDKALGKIDKKVADELSSAVQGYVNRDEEEDEDVSVGTPKKDPEQERAETLSAAAARTREGLRDLGDDIPASGRGSGEDDDIDALSPGGGSASGTPDGDAYDVQVVQKMGDRVLARIKGSAKGKVVYRFMTVSSAELKQVTGSPELRPGNIHDYIHTRDKKYKDARRQLEGEYKAATTDEEKAEIKRKFQQLKQRQHNSFNNDPAKAYARLREGQQKPEKFEDWLKQQVGSSAKEGLLNAAHRKSQTGKLDKNIVSLIMQMNDEQANMLVSATTNPKDTKFAHPKVSLSGLRQVDVVKYLDKLRQEFGPTAESVNSDSDPINERFGDTIRRMGRALKRKMTPDDIRYARRLAVYNAAVTSLANDPEPMLRIMQKAGNHPKQMRQPAQEPVEVTPTWEPDSKVNARRAQYVSQAIRKFSNAMFNDRRTELIDQISGGNYEHPVYKLIGHASNQRIPELVQTANSSSEMNKLFTQFEQAMEKLSAEEDDIVSAYEASVQVKDAPKGAPKVDTSRLDGIFEKIAPMLAEPKYVKMLEHYAQAYEKSGVKNAMNLVKAIANKDLKSLAIATQDPTLKKSLDMLLTNVISTIYLRWANDIQEAQDQAKSESFVRKYSAAILETPEIAEARIDAHDLAEAGIDLYVERCRVLGRSQLSKMYDAELDQIFEDLVESAYGRFEEYRDLMESKMDFLRLNPFSDLIAILSLTEDPVTRIDVIREYVEDPTGVTKSYRNSLIAPPTKSKYSPISNIV